MFFVLLLFWNFTEKRFHQMFNRNIWVKKEGRKNLGTPRSADLIAASCNLDSSFKIIVQKTFWKIAKWGFFKSMNSWLCKSFWISKWFFYFLFRSFSSYKRIKTMSNLWESKLKLKLNYVKVTVYKMCCVVRKLSI